MKFWSPGKTDLVNLSKHGLFALKEGYDILFGFAPYVYWNTYGPTLSVMKVSFVDATLTTVEIFLMEERSFGIGTQFRDDIRYVFWMEILR